MVSKSLDRLISYCENQQFQGYDPYDTLNSWFPFHWFSKWGPPMAIQIQKRNPINIRPVIGVKKGINPKGMGLFLKAYSLLYKKTEEQQYLLKAEEIFNWLNNNYSKGYSGKCWGYNFHWATPGSYLKAYTPSVVVTSFVIDGVFEYYNLTNDKQAKELIDSASSYIAKDIPVTEFDKGISYAYTHLSKGACYNASLLAAEVLAKADFVNKTTKHKANISKAVCFVISQQKENGEWWYSLNPKSQVERKQIDFHQGFILVSLQNILNLTGILKEELSTSIEKGLNFYRKEQFFNNGRSLWRIPQKWPVDIHNQSQGIITFSRFNKYNSEYLDFAKKIANWTIENMQSPKGYFYYRKNRFSTNRIPYIRWSQAWMMLALSELLNYEK